MLQKLKKKCWIVMNVLYCIQVVAYAYYSQKVLKFLKKTLNLVFSKLHIFYRFWNTVLVVVFTSESGRVLRYCEFDTG